LNPALTQGLALLNQSAGSMICLENFVDILTGPIVSGLSSAGVTSGDVLGWMRTISVPDGFNLTVNPELTLGGLTLANFFGAAALGVMELSELEFHKEGVLERTMTVPINLGSTALDSKIALGADAQIQAAAALSYSFSFGVDLRTNTTPALTLEDRLFFRFDKLNLSVSVDASQFNAGLRIGFLSAGVVNGSARLQAGIGLRFNDPNNDGRITLTELLGDNDVPDSGQPSLVSFSTEGALCVTLPVQALLGTFKLGDPSTAITLTDPDLFDATPPDFRLNGDFSQFLDFTDLDYSVVWMALRHLPDALRGIGDLIGQALPDVRIPDLSSVVDFADRFSNVLGNLDPSNGNLETINDLTDALQQALDDAGMTDLPRITVNPDKDIELGFKLRDDFQEDGANHLSVGLNINTPTPIVADAWLGFLDVGITDGQIWLGANHPNDPSMATAVLTLNDPNGDGKITLEELADHFTGDNGVLNGLKLTGKASLECTVSPLDGVSDTSGKLGVYWDDLNNLEPSRYDTSGLDAFLTAAPQFDGDHILNTITDFAGRFVDDLLRNPIFNQPLPFVDLSLGDALKSFTAYLVDFFNAIENQGDANALDAAIQTARDQIAQEISDAAGDSGISLTNFTVDPRAQGNWQNPDQGRFRYLLTFKAGLDNEYPFQFGPSFLSLDGTVSVSLQLTVKLEFGYDPQDGFYLVDLAKADPSALLDPNAPGGSSLPGEFTLTGTVGVNHIHFQGSIGNDGLFACGVKDGNGGCGSAGRIRAEMGGSTWMNWRSSTRTTACLVC
jgi:hypothetical protein